MALLAFVGGLWFASMCSDVVDPSIHYGQQTLGASVGQLVQRDVRPSVC